MNNWGREFGILFHQSICDDESLNFIKALQICAMIKENSTAQMQENKSFLFYRPESYLEKVAEYQSPWGVTANCTN